MGPLVGVGNGHKPPAVEVKPTTETVTEPSLLDAEVEVLVEEGEDVESMLTDVEVDVLELEDDRREAEKPEELPDTDTCTVITVLMTVGNVVEERSTVLVKEETNVDKDLELGVATAEVGEPVGFDDDDSAELGDAEAVSVEGL